MAIAPVSTVGTQTSVASNTATNNQKTGDNSKLIAYTALGTGLAMAIPVSIMAARTGKIAQSVETLQKDTAPLLKNVSDITGVVTTLSNTVATKYQSFLNEIPFEEMAAKTKEIVNAVDSKEVKVFTQDFAAGATELVTTLKNKLSEEDFSKIAANIQELIATLSEKIKSASINI